MTLDVNVIEEFRNLILVSETETEIVLSSLSKMALSSPTVFLGTITPGISRSGMTISCALLMGINAKDAAKFSFLMAIPVISGAGFLTFLDSYNNFSIPISIGFVALFSSFIIGVLALRWLLNWLGEGKFHYFGIYCILLGLFMIIN